MSESSSESPDSAAVLESMTLLATLSTAETVRESVAERRAGRDPSPHPPAVALILLEYCPQNLHDFIHTEYRVGAQYARLRAAVRRIARILKSLQMDKGYDVQDLRPESLLVRSDTGGEPEILMGDPLALKRAGDDADRPFTRQYAAPEVVTNPEGEVDAVALMWAFGMVAFEVLEGFPPYKDEKRRRVRDQRLGAAGPDWVATGHAILPELAPVIDHCLTLKRHNRPESWLALLAALEAASGDTEAATVAPPVRRPGEGVVAPGRERAFETFQDAGTAPALADGGGGGDGDDGGDGGV